MGRKLLQEATTSCSITPLSWPERWQQGSSQPGHPGPTNSSGLLVSVFLSHQDQPENTDGETEDQSGTWSMKRVGWCFRRFQEHCDLFPTLSHLVLTSPTYPFCTPGLVIATPSRVFLSCRIRPTRALRQSRIEMHPLPLDAPTLPAN